MTERRYLMGAGVIMRREKVEQVEGGERGGEEIDTIHQNSTDRQTSERQYLSGSKMRGSD